MSEVAATATRGSQWATEGRSDAHPQGTPLLCCSWSLNVEPANLQMLSPGPGKIIHIVLVTNIELDSDKSVATETRKYHSMLEPGAEWMCLQSSTRVCQSQGFRKEKPSPSSSLPTRWFFIHQQIFAKSPFRFSSSLPCSWSTSMWAATTSLTTPTASRSTSTCEIEFFYLGIVTRKFWDDFWECFP